ncbi:MAG: AzlC family ABC transporter permease [Saccharofermentanales bacterium]
MLKEVRYAFVRTTPVLAGYIFLGIAFGLLLHQAGYNYIWAFFISLFVYAGSMQFVLIGFLGSTAGIIPVILMTLSVNSRHIFYGLSFIEKFKKMKRAFPYMVFSLTDETYSLLCATKVPDNLDEDKVFLSIALLDQLYWIVGSVIGATIGELILFDLTGIDFAMTALFVVIFVEQWLAAESHIPAITGIFCAILCLLLLGQGNFILAALISTIGVLILGRKKIEAKEHMLP